MGRRMRAFDWSATPLGDPATWPRSLRTAVRIMLTSRQPMFVWWGEQLVNLYNDPYRMVLGGKHPDALGRPAQEVWHEIWDQVGPRAESALRKNEGTFDEALRLIMERNGYPEETYFTFSYSPVPDDDGGTGGIFCANSDESRRIIGERRLRVLRETSSAGAGAHSVAHAAERSTTALAADGHDVPFALLYLPGDDGRTFRLASAAGTPSGASAAPERIDDDATAPWPVAAVAKAGETRIVDLDERLRAGIPGGVWQRAPHQAAIVPIGGGEDGVAAVLVAGLNPFRPLDDDYRGFLELAAAHVTASIASATAYEEERRRAETLAELDRAKTVFFSNVSHEFRTPLTLMLAPLDELRTRAHGDDREQLELLHRNALRLQKLVNTLLDFSRIEAGRMRAHFAPTDLAALTADLASTFRSACEKAGLALEVDCVPLAEPVWVDREMWEKVVLNLLSNAFKFTFTGGIRVSLATDAGHVRLRVADTGSGIAADDLPHVFERFRRIEGAAARTHEGTGIGLALVQELVRLHGGSVGVESAPGRGSTFTVTIPLGHAHLPREQLVAHGADAERPGSLADGVVGEALRWLPDPIDPAGATDAVVPAVEAAVLPGSSDAAASQGRRARIVLADDNADMRGYLRRLLATRYEVEALPDGAAALEAIRREPPDLVLSDVMMPRLDGFGLLRALREDEATRAIPVVLLSARAGEEARIEGLEHGADDYLVKPFSAGELLARVGARLELARARRTVEDALRDADRRKDEFLATLAHELRNPLAPMRNALHALRIAGPDAPAAGQMHAMMERQVNHMVRLVDDLLEVSRITRGKIELRMEQVDLAAVVRAAVETSRPLIDAGGHALHIGLPPEPVALRADPVRLAQVIGNLLNNAAKYTPRGGHIRLEVRPGGGEVELEVRDDGVGIPHDMLGKVFDLFTQVDHTRAAAQGGLGIGLTLVRHIVELHGGRIEATSPGPDRGSSFRVRLPIVDGQPPAPPADEPRDLATGPSRRVLVVDDNVDAAESLGLLLRFLGAEVQVAHDGPSALAMLDSFEPELVLLDIGMPGMDGYQVAARVRALPSRRRTMLIALTGWGQSEDRERSRAAGFDEHFVKPVDISTLQSLLA